MAHEEPWPRLMFLAKRGQPEASVTPSLGSDRLGLATYICRFPKLSCFRPGRWSGNRRHFVSGDSSLSLGLASGHSGDSDIRNNLTKSHFP